MPDNFERSLMRLNKKYFITLGLLLTVVSLSITPVTNAANPDDGYPEGQAAPGRTCPNNDEGFKQVSAFSGKTLVCINSWREKMVDRRRSASGCAIKTS